MANSTKYQEFPITWERGLIETVEESMLPPGAASLIQNWTPDTSGGLRARVGWTKGSTTSVPSTRVGWGIGHLALPHRPYLRQSKQGTTAAGTDPKSVAATWNSATLTGSTLIAVISLSNSSSSRIASSYTITPPAGWVSGVTPQNSARTGQGWLYYKDDAASESGSVSFTVESTGGADTIALAITILEVPNLGAIDVTDYDDEGATEPQVIGPVSPTTPVSFSVAAGGGTGSSQSTYAAQADDFTAFTAHYVDNGTVDLNSLVLYKASTTWDDITATIDRTSGLVNNGWSLLVTFKGENPADTDGFYVVANNEDPDMVLYYIDRDDVDGGTWATLQTHSNTDSDVVPFAFTSGNEMLFWTHPSLENVWAWGGTGTTPAAISGSTGGRCVAFHKNRLYVGGGTGEPWKLFFSATGDHTDWTGTDAGYIEVGKGDGEAIEDVLPFEDGLLIGKQTSLWFLIGNGAATHKLIRIPDGGCAPGRTLLSTPYGAIVAGRNEVHLYTGGEARLISRPIRESYGITGDFMTCSVRDEAAYICDQLSGHIWVIDFASGGTWHIEIVDYDSSTEGPACIYNQGRDQLYAPINAFEASLLNIRSLPGSERAKDFDALGAEYRAQTPVMWLAGPSKKFSPMYLFAKIRQRGADSDAETGINVVPTIDGVTGTTINFPPEATAGVRWYRKRITSQGGIYSIQLRFSQNMSSGETALMEVEEARIGYDVEDIR